MRTFSQPPTHWGHRRIGPLSEAFLQAPEPDEDASGFRDLLDAARKAVPADHARGLEDKDAVTVLGQRRGDPASGPAR